jgi:hypothetical protein
VPVRVYTKHRGIARIRAGTEVAQLAVCQTHSFGKGGEADYESSPPNVFGSTPSLACPL